MGSRCDRRRLNGKYCAKRDTCCLVSTCCLLNRGQAWGKHIADFGLGLQQAGSCLAYNGKNGVQTARPESAQHDRVSHCHCQQTPARSATVDVRAAYLPHSLCLLRARCARFGRQYCYYWTIYYVCVVLPFYRLWLFQACFIFRWFPVSHCCFV